PPLSLHDALPICAGSALPERCAGRRCDRQPDRAALARTLIPTRMIFSIGCGCFDSYTRLRLSSLAISRGGSLITRSVVADLYLFVEKIDGRRVQQVEMLAALMPPRRKFLSRKMLQLRPPARAPAFQHAADIPHGALRPGDVIDEVCVRATV